MEKYEFRAKQPVWVWTTAAMVMVCVLIYTAKRSDYLLLIIWSIYYIFVLINNYRLYTIMPNRFIMKSGLAKPLIFSLESLTEIEKKHTKDNQLKSIIIKYASDSKPNNFLVIKKYDTNIEGILNAILDYCPSVPVH